MPGRTRSSSATPRIAWSATSPWRGRLAAATAAKDRRHAKQAELGRLDVQSDYDFERFLQDGPAAIDSAVDVFREPPDDDRNLGEAWQLLALIHAAVGRST